jgi:hypothetical protein
MFAKLSILLQYRRLFGESQDFRWHINLIISLVILWCLTILVVASVLCVPIRKLWEPATPGVCLDLIQFYYGLQVPNIVTDVWIIVSPIWKVLHLDLEKRIKVGATAMFMLGLITLVFDIIRLTAMVRLGYEGPDLTCTFA